MSQVSQGWDAVFHGIEIKTICKAHGHDFLFYLTLEILPAFRRFEVFFQGSILAGAESKFFRKNKECASHIRISTQKTSSAAVWSRAFHVCFRVKIGCILFRLHADNCTHMIRANLPFISHRISEHLSLLSHLIEFCIFYYYRKLRKWNWEGG